MSLFPELPEHANRQAQALIIAFKERLKKAADEAISEFYCDVAVWIESDSWQNFRNEILRGLSCYSNKKDAPYDFERIRRSIFEEYKDEIINDLNQDLVKRIDELEQLNADLRRFR